jgi:hypothetical protein
VTHFVFGLVFQPSFHVFLVAQRNLTECHMALFPASHVVVVGGGFAGMVVANQAANFCAFGQTKP